MQILNCRAYPWDRACAEGSVLFLKNVLYNKSMKNIPIPTFLKQQIAPYLTIAFVVVLGVAIGLIFFNSAQEIEQEALTEEVIYTK